MHLQDAHDRYNVAQDIAVHPGKQRQVPHRDRDIWGRHQGRPQLPVERDLAA